MCRIKVIGALTFEALPLKTVFSDRRDWRTNPAPEYFITQRCWRVICVAFVLRRRPLGCALATGNRHDYYATAHS